MDIEQNEVEIIEMEVNQLNEELLELYRENRKLKFNLEKANKMLVKQQGVLHKFKEAAEQSTKQQGTDLDLLLQNIKEFTNNNDLESFDVSTPTHNVLSEFVKLFGFELGTNIDYLNLNNIFNTINDFNKKCGDKHIFGNISTTNIDIVSEFVQMLGINLESDLDYLNLDSIFKIIKDFIKHDKDKIEGVDISTTQFNILADFAKLLGYNLNNGNNL